MARKRAVQRTANRKTIRATNSRKPVKRVRAYIVKALIGNRATAKHHFQRYVVSRDRLRKFYRYVGKRKFKGRKVDVFERIFLMRFKGKTISFEKAERNTTLYRGENVVYESGRTGFKRDLSVPLANTRTKTYYAPAPSPDGFFIHSPDKSPFRNPDLIHFLQYLAMTFKRRNPDVEFWRFEGMGTTENPDNPLFTCGGYMNHDVADAIETFLGNLDFMSLTAPSGKEGMWLKEFRVNLWVLKEMLYEKEYEALKTKRV